MRKIQPWSRVTLSCIPRMVLAVLLVPALLATAAFADDFADDFSTDTTGSYALAHLWTKGGTGRLVYDAAGQRAQLLTGDNISSAFLVDVSAASDGSFGIDVRPTARLDSWGLLSVRLSQDERNYYRIVNTSGSGPAREIIKVVDGQVVDRAVFAAGYVQNRSYTIAVDFSPAATRVAAYGEVHLLDGHAGEIEVRRIEIEAAQQHAYVDNLVYSTFTWGSGGGSGQTAYVALGDSITRGTDDDEPSDDVSSDGRVTGGGYPPILSDLLTGFYGRPHHVANEGVPGDKSSDGVARITSVLAMHANASHILLQYGTNDASVRNLLPVPSGLGLTGGMAGYAGTFKHNMQRIIDAAVAAGRQVCLAKIPVTLASCNLVDQCPPYIDPASGAKNVVIEDYNAVIDELFSDPRNGITVTPPDFFAYFSSIDPGTGRFRYEDEFATPLHPNGAGYQAMADIWFENLTR